MARRLGRILIALLLGACGTPERERVATSQAEVAGTVDDANQFPMVVGIKTVKGQNLSRCTGTLVAPNLVLTARHCVAVAWSGPLTCGQAPMGSTYGPENVTVTTMSTMTDVASDWLSVSRIETAPGGDDSCGFDFAALVLSDAGFGSAAKVSVPRIDRDVDPSETFTAVGYGTTGSGGLGTRRFKTDVAVNCVGSACAPTYPATSTEWISADDAFCQSDSGSAALDASGKLIGNVTRGVAPCTTPILNAMPAWKSWLMEVGQAAAVEGGYEQPFWATSGSSDPPTDAGSDAPIDAGVDATGDDAGTTVEKKSSGDDGGCATSPSHRCDYPWLFALLVFSAASGRAARRSFKK